MNKEYTFFAPGRVNILGEHIDYNGGLVAPTVITNGTSAKVEKIEKRELEIYSENFPDLKTFKISLDNLEYRKEDNYTNYIKGIFYYLQKLGFSFNHGLKISIKGDIPGGGLSSSASLEILVCNIIEQIYKLNLSKLDYVKISVKVENEYLGVSSGVMDQYSIMFGKKGYLTLIDCNKLTHEYIPFNLENKTLLILNTNKKRTLQDSKYNERYNECMSGLKTLKQYININNLSELSISDFEKYKDKLDDVIRKRVKHVVYESNRMKELKTALSKNDFKTLEKLMSLSHESLKNDYEVTGFHLDSIVEACNEVGIYAARMTGAGFGGNAICIIDNDKMHLVDEIKKKYFEKTNIHASITKG